MTQHEITFWAALPWAIAALMGALAGWFEWDLPCSLIC